MVKKDNYTREECAYCKIRRIANDNTRDYICGQCVEGLVEPELEERKVAPIATVPNSKNLSRNVPSETVKTTHEKDYIYGTIKTPAKTAYDQIKAGRILAREGKYQDAKNHFDAAMNKGLEMKKHWWKEYGYILEKIGLISQALASYREAGDESSLKKVDRLLIKLKKEQKQTLKSLGVKSLWYIVAISNVRSIIKLGILSHNRVEEMKVPHRRIDNLAVQERRKKKVVYRENGESVRLHDLAPLFFTPASPMFYVVGKEDEVECLLEIDRDIILNEQVIFADGNAAISGTKFSSNLDFLRTFDWDLIINETYPYLGDIGEKKNYTWRKSAEVLIPGRIEPKYIKAIHIPSSDYRYYETVCKIIGMPGSRLIRKSPELFNH